MKIEPPRRGQRSLWNHSVPPTRLPLPSEWGKLLLISRACDLVAFLACRAQGDKPHGFHWETLPLVPCQFAPNANRYARQACHNVFCTLDLLWSCHAYYLQVLDVRVRSNVYEFGAIALWMVDTEQSKHGGGRWYLFHYLDRQQIEKVL